jgi:hypothetical protein
MSPTDTKENKKPIKDIDSLPIKRKALAILTENGMTTAEAGKALEYKGNSVYDAKFQLNKYALSNKKLGSLAFKAIKETMKMKPLITEDRKICSGCENEPEKKENCIICNGLGYMIKVVYPSHSDRVKAAGMYYDRTDPVVVTKVDPKETQSFTNVTVNNYIVNNNDKQIENCKDITPDKDK